MQNVNENTASNAITTSDTAAPAPVAVTPAVAAPAKPKRVSKPKAAKPTAVVVKPSKPANADKSAAHEQRVKLNDANRAIVSRIYNDPSLAVRGSVRNVAAAAYAELFAAPKHRTTLDRVSIRDESALALIVKHSASGSFDPSALNIDRGIFSRLRSIGYIVAGTKAGFYSLSKAGLTHAKRVGSKAA